MSGTANPFVERPAGAYVASLVGRPRIRASHGARLLELTARLRFEGALEGELVAEMRVLDRIFSAHGRFIGSVQVNGHRLAGGLGAHLGGTLGESDGSASGLVSLDEGSGELADVRALLDLRSNGGDRGDYDGVVMGVGR